MSGKEYKARTPVQKRGIESKTKIIEAAILLFTEKGYHKTNALEIAARAGVATGTFYSYFNNKKEVLIEVIKLFFKEVSEKVLFTYKVEIHNNKSDNFKEGKNLVHFMIQTLYAAHSLNPELHREIIAMILLDKEIEAINHEEEMKVISSMTSILMNYKDFIRVSDIEAGAILLYRASEEIIHRIKIVGAEIDEDRLLNELEDMICRYLLIPE